MRWYADYGSFTVPLASSVIASVTATSGKWRCRRWIGG